MINHFGEFADVIHRTYFAGKLLNPLLNAYFSDDKACNNFLLQGTVKKIRTYEISFNLPPNILSTTPCDGPGTDTGEGNENIEDDKNQKIDLRYRCSGGFRTFRYYDSREQYRDRF